MCCPDSLGQGELTGNAAARSSPYRGGEIHEVLITPVGYVYRGETFRKLSSIARRITGTQWSSPAFFGTRTAEKTR